MSRGLGQLQQSILAEVEKARNKPTTLETLRWTLWDGKASPVGRLPQSLNTTVDRGVKSLADRGQLFVQSRPLEDLDEWVAHYPSKTLSIQIRDLRKELLPHIVAWLRSGDGPRVKFSRPKNEEFAARNLTTEQKEDLRSLWTSLEPSLRDFYAKTGSDNLFSLLVRGKQLFTRTSRATTPESLRELLMRCNNLPEGLREELHALIEKFLPDASAKALEFKSQVRAIANGVPTSGHCALSEKTVDELYRRCRDLLSGLPGFQREPIWEKNSNVVRFDIDPPRPQHSPLLKKILDHSVFQDFRFLTL